MHGSKGASSQLLLAFEWCVMRLLLTLPPPGSGQTFFYLIVTQHIYINFMEDCITLVCFNTMYVTLTTRQSVFVKQDMIYTIYPVGGHQ